MSQKIRLVPATISDLESVVSLHVASINSPTVKVGKWLINNLYHTLFRDIKSKIIVAKVNNEIAGFIAYTINYLETSRFIKQNLSLCDKAKLFTKLLINPIFLISHLKQSAFHLTFFKHIPSHSVYILTLAVNVRYRRHKIGTMLMSYCEKYAKNNKLKHIILDTQLSNKSAQSFYSKLNFNIVKTAFANLGMEKET